MGQDWLSCGTTQIGEKNHPLISAQYYAVRLDNGYGSRRLLLAYAFDRPHKSIHFVLSAMLTPNAQLSESQMTKLLLLITGLLCVSVIIALLFDLSSTIFRNIKIPNRLCVHSQTCRLFAQCGNLPYLQTQPADTQMLVNSPRLPLFVPLPFPLPLVI